MPPIPLPLLDLSPTLSTKLEDGKRWIHDPIRKRWYVLQPEEFVRQLWITYLVQSCAVPLSRISIEKGLSVNRQKRRYDLLVYDAHFNPQLLVECKSFKIPINDAVLQQIGAYNTELKVPYLVVSNGQTTYCCQIDQNDRSVTFLDQLPTLNRS